jgi:hypothetical protein
MTWAQYKRQEAEREAAEEAEFAKRQEENQANLTALRAKLARLQDTVIALEKKYGVTADWLCYLPHKAGGPEFMQRACAYLEEMRTRIQAEGGNMWLDCDHNASLPVFMISKFRLMGDAIFCTGEWTATGRKYRDTYRGISADNIVFAGDLDLLAEKFTPPCLHLDDAPASVKAAARSSPKVRGLAGAACLGMEPAYGRSPIFRLTRDNTTGRERLKPVKDVFDDTQSCQPFELPQLSTSDLTT